MATLEEPLKLEDIVPIGLCLHIHPVVSGYIFERIPLSAFYYLLNLRKADRELIVNNRQQGKVCYFIFRISNYIWPVEHTDEWVDSVIKMLNISKKSYDKHKTDPNKEDATDNEKKFMNKLNRAIESWEKMNS